MPKHIKNPLRLPWLDYRRPLVLVFVAAFVGTQLGGCVGPRKVPLEPPPVRKPPSVIPFEPSSMPKLSMPSAASAAGGSGSSGVRRRPNAAEIEAMDIGPRPTDYQARIRAFITPRLQNPATARLRFQEPPKKGVRTVGSDIKVSWFVVAFLNERTRRGAKEGEYTGEDRYYFFFEDGAIVDFRNFDADLRRLSN